MTSVSIVSMYLTTLFFLLKSFLGSLKLHYEGYVWLAPVKIFIKIFRLFDY